MYDNGDHGDNFDNEHMPWRMASQLVNNLNRVSWMYSYAVFTIRTIVMVIEFEKIRAYQPGVMVNVAAAAKPLEEIEKIGW